jgi:hypothetical protein
LRGTKNHPKKPAFLRPIKSFIFLKYMPRLHLLPSRISKFSGGVPPDPPPSLPAHAYDVRACPDSNISPSTWKLFENPESDKNDRLKFKYSLVKITKKVFQFSF